VTLVIASDGVPRRVTHPLEPLVRPRSVAIVGASADPRRIAGKPAAYVKKHGFSGRLYLVNPRYTQIDGVACLPSIAELPEPPDVALVLLGTEAAASAVRQLAERGARSAIVLAGGYAEIDAVQVPYLDVTASHQDLRASHQDLRASHQDLRASHQDLRASHQDLRAQGHAAGPQVAASHQDLGTPHRGEGLRRQAALVEAAGGNLRLLGPNTIGIVNVTDRTALSASGALELDALQPGSVAVVSQSGGMLGALLSRGTAHGLGFSRLISTGNEADVDVCDVLDYLLQDDATRVMACTSKVCGARGCFANWLPGQRHVTSAWWSTRWVDLKLVRSQPARILGRWLEAIASTRRCFARLARCGL
jgi:acetate---CoA ligase (ADP-forming)